MRVSEESRGDGYLKSKQETWQRSSDGFRVPKGRGGVLKHFHDYCFEFFLWRCLSLETITEKLIFFSFSERDYIILIFHVSYNSMLRLAYLMFLH